MERLCLKIVERCGTSNSFPVNRPIEKSELPTDVVKWLRLTVEEPSVLQATSSQSIRNASASRPTRTNHEKENDGQITGRRQGGQRRRQQQQQQQHTSPAPRDRPQSPMSSPEFPKPDSDSDSDSDYGEQDEDDASKNDINDILNTARRRIVYGKHVLNGTVSKENRPGISFDRED